MSPRQGSPDEGVLRSIIEYEAEVIAAHLMYETMPIGLRRRIERQRDRLRVLAKGSTEPWVFQTGGMAGPYWKARDPPTQKRLKEAMQDG